MISSQRFGEVAVELGYLSGTQVTHALSIQEREDDLGLPHRHIGRICVELGYLARNQVLSVLEQQGMMVGAVR